MIVSLYWARDEQAITETDIKYGEMCMKISMNTLKNIEDAQENVNDTYFTAWNVIPPNRPMLLGSFIAKITRNLSLKRFAYSNARKRKPKSLVDFDLLSESLTCETNVEQGFEAQLLAESISRFLKEQGYEERLIFLRKYWYLDSIKDIAERYNMSVGTIKSTLFRMRNKLKEHLISEGIAL